MASKITSMAALFLVLNLVFSTAISARNVDCPPNTKPKARPSPSTPTSCPRDAFKLGVCVNVLNGLVNATVGMPPKQPCCSLIQGLADVEAAVCLCTAIKANILGLNLNIPISLSLLLNHCGSNVPRGFQCA